MGPPAKCLTVPVVPCCTLRPQSRCPARSPVQEGDSESCCKSQDLNEILTATVFILITSYRVGGRAGGGNPSLALGDLQINSQ